MSQPLPTTSQALELARGYRAAQNGEVFDFLQSEHWKRGHMMATARRPYLGDLLLISSLDRDCSSKSQPT